MGDSHLLPIMPLDIYSICVYLTDYGGYTYLIFRYKDLMIIYRFIHIAC